MLQCNQISDRNMWVGWGCECKVGKCNVTWHDGGAMCACLWIGKTAPWSSNNNWTVIGTCQNSDVQRE